MLSQKCYGFLKSIFFIVNCDQRCTLLKNIIFEIYLFILIKLTKIRLKIIFLKKLTNNIKITKITINFFITFDRKRLLKKGPKMRPKFFMRKIRPKNYTPNYFFLKQSTRIARNYCLKNLNIFFIKFDPS